VTRAFVPDEILDLAHARAAAREARDWAEADRLRAAIEAAGWRIADRGTDFALTPATPPDLVEGEHVRYGASQNVPSRLEEAATGLATVVVVATDWPDDLTRTLTALRAISPDGTSVVIVADGPSAAQAASLETLTEAARGSGTGSEPEVIWTSERLGHAAAVNIGVRRATAPVVIVLDTSAEPLGDIVTPLVQALDDPTVGVAGPWGFVSGDLRKFDDAPGGDVVAIGGYLLAFRRSDFVGRGPLDERFRFYRNLDIWWSLVLRDAGEGSAPRRAVAIDGMPVTRHEHRGWTSLPDDERDRQSKRNFYRIIDRFGSRRDLLLSRD
jgi:hypothetical protein